MNRPPDPVDSDPKDRARAQSSVPVSRETEDRFALFVDELRRWQTIKNLVGPHSLKVVWTRHVADCAQLFGFAPKARHWLDLGSGGGFPGIVLGIMLAEVGGHIHLVESNSRKCAFLRAAARVSGAAATVHEGRIEATIERFTGNIDVVTARALAPLPQLLEWTKVLLRTDAIGLFPKGQDVDAELTLASKSWSIEADVAQSRTDVNGRILIVKRLNPRSES